MTAELKNLELNEVSLVGKGANGKKFLIFKSINNPRGRITMKDTKPAGARKGAGSEAPVTKSYIDSVIRKAVTEAVSGVKAENVALRKELQTEKGYRRDAEIAAVVKKDFSDIGDPQKMVKVLKSLEESGIPADVQKDIKDALMQANAAKRESMKILGSQIGTSKAAPGTPAGAFNAAVDARLSEIQKSATAPSDPKVAHAQAVTWVTQNKPELYRALTEGV